MFNSPVPSKLLNAAFPVPDDEISERRQKYIDGLTFRAVVSLVFLVMFVTLDKYVPNSRTPLSPLIGALLSLALLNVIYWILGRNREFSLRLFYVHWLLDLGIISTILFLLGGIDIPYGLLAFMMLIVTSATFLSFHASLVVAALAAGVTIVMATLQTLDLVMPPRAWAVTYPIGTRIIAVTVATVFYFIFAYLAGTLADRLKAANVRLRGAQSEIAEQNRLLEDKVSSRTRELANRNAEIEEFVHIVTHDLKNVSIGAAETARLLLSRAELQRDERVIRYARHLLDDTRRMNSMLVQLLALFRIDKQSEQRSMVSLSDLLGELITAFESQAEARKIKISVGALPQVYANAPQLKHVITNILDNAVKYSGDKEYPEIAVRCIEEPTEWLLEIRDNGVGIPSAQQERVFQLYYRGANQTVLGVNQQGDGVGLAICKRIVERWNGRISIDSSVNEGTAVTVAIPRGA